MAKYRLEISDAISGEVVEALNFKEAIEQDAKKRIYADLLKNLREDLLACSKENNKVLVDHGLTIENVEKEKFIGTDYEFYLTSEPDDKTKYHISAFYNTFHEQAEDRALVNRWNSFLDSKRKTKN